MDRFRLSFGREDRSHTNGFRFDEDGTARKAVKRFSKDLLRPRDSIGGEGSVPLAGKALACPRGSR